MGVIPGRYIDNGGNEVTVIALAHDGDSGESSVIYRKGSRTFTLHESSWLREGRFTYAGDAEYEEYMTEKSEAELIHRIFTLISPRTDVYSLYWKNALGVKGYNYACENHSLVAGCYRGSDSCKNCVKGRLCALNEKAVAEHLRGEKTVGIYPVSSGLCRFLVFMLDSFGRAAALRETCEQADIPCYTEAREGKFRLWIFFSESLPLKYLHRMGDLLIERAMERSPEIDFGLYDRFIPCRDSIAEGSKGFVAELPFGKVGKNSFSRFVDSEGLPLEGGNGEVFRVRTVTKGYLSDRLTFLKEDSGEAEFPEKLEIILNGGIVFQKSALPPKTAVLLKRMAAVKNAQAPYREFESPEPSYCANFTEDKNTLKLPGGLWEDVEILLKMSKADYTVNEAFTKGDKVHLSLCRGVGEEQLSAAAQLGTKRRGILSAPLGWGKTGAAAALIAEKQLRTLVLVADENTRRRWVGIIMDYFGVDAERSGSKIQVRLISDKAVKDKYGLILLADCSRLPIDGEIFGRISALNPEYIYGITAGECRGDKREYIHMLCGSVITK